MSDLIFGTKAGVVKRTFMLDKELRELHTAYFPRIEVNGQMVFISDPNTPTGRVEFQSYSAARRFAKEFLSQKRGESNEERD